MRTFFGVALLASAGAAVSARKLGQPVAVSVDACPSLEDMVFKEIVPALDGDKKWTSVCQDYERCDEQLGTYLESLVPKFAQSKINITKFCSKQVFYTKACVLQVDVLADTAEELIKIIEVAKDHGMGRRLALTSNQCPNLMTMLLTILEKGLEGLLPLLEKCDMELQDFLGSLLPEPFSNIPKALCAKKDLIEAVCEVHVNHAVDLLLDAVAAFKDIHPDTVGKLVEDLLNFLMKLFPNLSSDLIQLLADVMPPINDIKQLLKDLDLKKIIQDVENVIHDITHRNQTVGRLLQAAAEPTCPEGLMAIIGEIFAGGAPNLLHGLEHCAETVQQYLAHMVAGIPSFVKTILGWIGIHLDVNTMCSKNKFFAIACAENVDVVAKFVDDLVQIVMELIHSQQK